MLVCLLAGQQRSAGNLRQVACQHWTVRHLLLEALQAPLRRNVRHRFYELFAARLQRWPLCILARKNL